MDDIENIDGLTVEQLINHKRLVRYQGKECPLIKRIEIDEDDEPFDSWETYQTPIGVVQRHYYARGEGLEWSGVDWVIVPAGQIADAQQRFEKASKELEAARQELERFISKA